MKRFEKLILVVLIGFVLIFMGACKKSSEIERISDIVEIKYERMKPIISPQWEDPTGLLLFHSTYGAIIPSLTKISESEWTTAIELQYSAGKYAASLIDAKIVKEYIFTAYKISVRIQGESGWKELTHRVPHTQGNGEQAEFIINESGIHVEF
jgi:hypothetical protein